MIPFDLRDQIDLMICNTCFLDVADPSHQGEKEEGIRNPFYDFFLSFFNEISGKNLSFKLTAESKPGFFN